MLVKMSQEVKQDCDVLCIDDRKKVFDISHLHCLKTMNEISRLRSKSLLFDVVIKSDGRSFRAHKLLLAASCDYFHAMFTKKMLESDKSEIVIDGISDGMEHILNFIYTAKLELTLSNVQDILSAANYFQLQSVIDACLNFLEGELDMENCIDMLIISENYSLITLRDKVLKFICQRISEISRGGEFFRLQEHQVVQLLISDFPVDCSEAEILRIILNWILKCDKSFVDIDKLLANVNFKDIPVNEIERVTKLLEIKRCDEIFAKIWNLVVVPSTKSLMSNEQKLLNQRGMELAIIKIGGFEMTGITNEITYSFPSATNPPQILESWRYLTEIPHVKQGSFGISVLNNCIFVIGGSYDISLDNEDIHPFGFKYNPLFNSWTSIRPMNFDRCRFSLNVLEDFLIAVGGHSEGSLEDQHENAGESTVEKYDPKTDSWTMMMPLPEYRSQHAATTFKNKLFISGGIDQYGNILDSMFEYDSTNDTWTKLRNTTPRADHVMLRIDKKIYICGGWEENDGQRRLISSIDCYDIETEEITTVTHINTPRYHAGITLVHDKIYIIGGFAADDIFRHTATKIEVYDITENKWYFPDKYPKHIWEHNLTTLYLQRRSDRN